MQKHLQALNLKHAQNLVHVVIVITTRNSGRGKAMNFVEKKKIFNSCLKQVVVSESQICRGANCLAYD